MTEQTTQTPAPCGSWRSPITIDAMLAAGTGLSRIGADGGQLHWLESRPADNGRTILVRATDGGGEPEVLTPAPANVRGRVQEYGGGVWHAAEDIVAWCNDADGAVHVIEGGEDRPITQPDKQFCYGDLVVVPRHRLVLAVREDHHGEGEAVTELVWLSLDDDNIDGGRVLATGADFYAHPVLGDDDRLAWVEWDHPNMPWDSTRIMVARFAEGRSSGAQQVAGGEGVSAVHPKWSPNGTLFFISDADGFWNPWALGSSDTAPRNLAPVENDFCRPLWVLGNDLYAVLDDERLLVMCYEDGRARLGVLHVGSGELRWVPQTFGDVDSICSANGTGHAIVDFDDHGSELVRLVDTPDGLALETVREASTTRPEAAFVSRPESIWFDGQHGRTQAWYYAPTNANFRPLDGELPPMIVNTHGGPTGMAPGVYRSDYQFWTSRGFAVLDVNYSGSAGFGRAYRDRLLGQWGIADIDDCRDAVAAIVERGLADPNRLVIQGGSAGGYTTLQALVSTDIFAAGVCRYGIGDLEMLVTDTHKFESRYPFGLVAPYPEGRQVYLDRSPIHHVDRLSSPMLILQGLDDKVVPPNQAVAMADAVRSKGLPVALVMFEGEGHGFRQNATRRAVVEAQLSFFSQLFGFTPADEVPVLEVENL